MTTFSTNCTITNGVYNYVTGPNTRGTLQLLWSSLGLLLLCTWSVQHLNVPSQSLASRSSRQSWTRSIHRFGNKSKWMLITLIAPELALGKAFSDRYSAVKHCLSRTAIDGVEWNLSHSFFANMSGFVIIFENLPIPQPDAKSKTSSCIPSTIKNVADQADTRKTLEDSNRTTPPPQASESQVTPPETSGKELENMSLPRCCVKACSSLEDPYVMDAKAREHESRILGSLENMKQSRKIGLEAFVLTEQAASRGFGPIAWARGKHNTSLVDAAIGRSRLEDFPGMAEKNEYLRFFPGWYVNMVVLQGDRWAVDGCQLQLVWKMGVIKSLPHISKDELDDRNKGDKFSKGLAVVQVIWLLVQVAARVAGGSSIAQLEVVALAFAACSLITYLLLWHKPQDVQTPVYIKAVRYPTIPELSQLAVNGPMHFPPFRPSRTIPTYAWHCDGDPIIVDKLVFASLLGGVLFGGLHCAVWNLHFPTTVERLLWRIAALLTMSIPPVWSCRVH